MQSDGCTTCARTFFTLSFGGLPRNFFLDSISRLPRDRIVEMARVLFRASRVTQGRGCRLRRNYCPIPTCGKWKEPSNGEWKTNWFSCARAVLFSCGTLRRVCACRTRINLNCSLRDSSYFSCYRAESEYDRIYDDMHIVYTYACVYLYILY